MTDLVSRARDFATGTHQQVELPERFRGQPRPAHLKAVAGLAALVTDDTEVIAAAWLHDLVENTTITLDDIIERFGQGVGGLVAELVLTSRPSDGSPTVRNQKDLRQIARASSRVKIIWLADMIDTARDFDRNQGPLSPELFRRFSDIVEALSDGDKRLVAKLRDVHSKLAGKLRKQMPEIPAEPSPAHLVGGHRDPAIRVFLNAFKAADIAEPLLSFDESSSAADTARALREQNVNIAGLRQNGRISGYLELKDLTGGIGRDHAQSIDQSNTIEAGDPLADVIIILSRRSHCFVRSLGEINGVISLLDIQKPVVRMWLFGMLTLSELAISERVRQDWPGDAWQGLLPPGRLKKAQELLDERRRTGQPAGLLDCLQLPDKFLILASRPENLALLGLPTRNAAKKALKELGSLRNNLAHSQDIITHDWAQIVRLSHRLVSIADEMG